MDENFGGAMLPAASTRSASVSLHWPPTTCTPDAAEQDFLGVMYISRAGTCSFAIYRRLAKPRLHTCSLQSVEFVQHAQALDGFQSRRAWHNGTMTCRSQLVASVS
jgi:hypothetical protein